MSNLRAPTWITLVVASLVVAGCGVAPMSSRGPSRAQMEAMQKAQMDQALAMMRGQQDYLDGAAASRQFQRNSGGFSADARAPRRRVTAPKTRWSRRGARGVR